MILKFIFLGLSIFLLILFFSFYFVPFKENNIIIKKNIINQSNTNSMDLNYSSNSKHFFQAPTETFLIDKAKIINNKNNDSDDLCYTGEIKIEDIPIEEVFLYLLYIFLIYIKNY